MAGRIVRAVETNQGRVLMPWAVRVLPVLREVLPLRIFDKRIDVLGVNDAMSQYTARKTTARSKRALPDSRPTKGTRP